MTAPLFLFLCLYTLLVVVLGIVSAMETASLTGKDLRPHFAKLPAGRLREDLMAILANPFQHMHRTLMVSAGLNLALTTLIFYLAFGPLRTLGFSPWYTAPFLVLITVLLGDLLPKLVAARSPATVLRRTAWALQPLRQHLDPLAKSAERASELLLQLLVPSGVTPHTNITRDEVETLVEMRVEQAALDQNEADIISEVIDMASLSVRDCMVPRVDLTLVEVSKPDSVVRDALNKSLTRFVVVYQDTPDTVSGVVDVHDWKLAGRPEWHPFIKDVVFVPETFSALDALTQHLHGPRNCVLIADEYGGLEGMVTQEEIVDWLLYDAAPWQGETTEIKALDEDHGRYLADGSTRVDDICDRFDLQLHAPGIDTIGGFVFNELGYLPKQGERLKLPQVEIKVRRVSRRRIQQLELKLKSPLEAQLQDHEQPTDANAAEI